MSLVQLMTTTGGVPFFLKGILQFCAAAVNSLFSIYLAHSMPPIGTQKEYGIEPERGYSNKGVSMKKMGIC